MDYRPKNLIYGFFSCKESKKSPFVVIVLWSGRPPKTKSDFALFSSLIFLKLSSLIFSFFLSFFLIQCMFSFSNVFFFEWHIFKRFASTLHPYTAYIKVWRNMELILNFVFKLAVSHTYFKQLLYMSFVTSCFQLKKRRHIIKEYKKRDK